MYELHAVYNCFIFNNKLFICLYVLITFLYNILYVRMFVVLYNRFIFICVLITCSL